MSGFNKFSGEYQVKNHHVVGSEEKSVPSEKVTPSEEVEKGTNFLNYMEEPMHTIRRKDLDKFQWQSTASTGWFNIDHGWLKIKVYTLELYFYLNKL